MPTSPPRRTLWRTSSPTSCAPNTKASTRSPQIGRDSRRSSAPICLRSTATTPLASDANRLTTGVPAENGRATQRPRAGSFLGWGGGRLFVRHLDVRLAVAGPDQDQNRDDAQGGDHGAAQESYLEPLGERV